MYKLVLSIIALVFLISEICFSMAPDQVYEKVKDSVVVIKAYSNTGQLVGLGSGVILPSGSIVTNYHVIKMGSRYTVGQNNKTTQATVRAADSNKDLCLLFAPGIKAKPVQLGQAANLKVGERVYAIGAPQGLELSLSEGIVSQLRGGFPPIIQTTVAISPGSSGGGLFNKNGELVGITTFQLKEGQNLNFALPVEWVGLVAEKESSSTIGFDTKEKLEILYVISGPIHLGDEELSSWPPLHGMCFEADFTITTPVQKLFLRIETYGLEIPVPIFLNNQKVASLPPQAIRFGKARPNEWSKDRIIEIPNKNLVNGINRIIICTDLVGKPQFPGDKDDFQFRNFRLIAE